jgi:2-amino-4-hydroxy-6-hydroxymethyldihydropteridine diphosphokinase
MREPAKESCWKRVFIGLGTNLGDKEINLKVAVNNLKEVKGLRVIKVAPLYRSAPWGYREQEWFLNTVLEAKTILPPRELLSILLDIEKKMGRVREKRWGPRIIDLDLLIYGDLIINDPDLVIPHPYLAERPFVLVPLADLSPDLLIPGYGRAVELMNKLDRQEQELEKLN